MHIVQFHHVRLPVPKYGGAERIAVWLCQVLVGLGHQVTLLAPPGSRIPGVRVVEVRPEQVRCPEFDLRRYVSERVDIMHYHGSVAYAPAGVDWVWTLHGNLSGGRRIDDPPNCVSPDPPPRPGTGTLDPESTHPKSRAKHTPAAPLFFHRKKT